MVVFMGGKTGSGTHDGGRRYGNGCGGAGGAGRRVTAWLRLSWRQ